MFPGALPRAFYLCAFGATSLPYINYLKFENSAPLASFQNETTDPLSPLIFLLNPARISNDIPNETPSRQLNEFGTFSGEGYLWSD